MTARKKAPARKPAKDIRKPPAQAAAPAPPPAPEKTRSEVVRENIDAILALWSQGMSVRAAVKKLELPIESNDVHSVVWTSEELIGKWRAVSEYRAQALIEAAADNAQLCAASGDFKAAGELQLKLAAKTAPRLYGDKATVEHVGPHGGPIQSVTGVMSPEEAYRRMLGGGK